MNNNGISKGWLWLWRVIMILVIAFFLFDAVTHLFVLPAVAPSFAQLGLPLSLSVSLGGILLVSVALYCIPQTIVLGAILLTGYLGGAVLANMRIGASLFGAILFPVYVGILLWGTVYILDPRVRALIPLRKS